MRFLVLLQVFVVVFVGFVNSQQTACVDSQKHFANLCFAPKPFAFSSVDLNWIKESQPSDGWHCVLGNDISRLHYAEALRGKLLSATETNFDDLCLRVTISHGDNPNEAPDGQFLGFKNLTSNWSCKYSADFPETLLCDDLYPWGTNNHENYKYYLSYTDNKNLQVGIFCFPNGQVGWMAFAFTESITDNERKFIAHYVEALGFSADNTVSMYNSEKCSEQNSV